MSKAKRRKLNTGAGGETDASEDEDNAEGSDEEEDEEAAAATESKRMEMPKGSRRYPKRGASPSSAFEGTSQIGEGDDSAVGFMSEASVRAGGKPGRTSSSAAPETDGMEVDDAAEGDETQETQESQAAAIDAAR
jgi:hypothetical protein